LGHSFGATVALGAAPLARGLRRLVLYEPAPGVPQVAPAFLDRLDALLTGDEREELLSLFLTDAGLDSGALERLRASPIWPMRVAAAHTIPRELRAEEGYRPDPNDFASLTVSVLLLLGARARRGPHAASTWPGLCCRTAVSSRLKARVISRS
jgi:pimeloyl-ACP methyl ester carboxylesterase